MRTQLLTTAILVLLGAFMSPATAQSTKPTIVLVHGAFAESSSWNGVVAELLADGYPVVAAANPLRGVKNDAAFALEQGESTVEMADRFPGSTLGPTLATPLSLSDGGKDLYIQQDKFPAQFAADVPAKEATLAAATQRPIAEAALGEPSGAPTWKSLPSWHIYGDADKNIPPAAMAFMADRAKSKETVVLKGASHVPMVSQPKAVAAIIKRAAAGGT